MWCSGFVRTLPGVCSNTERFCNLKTCFWLEKSFSTSCLCLMKKPVHKKGGMKYQKKLDQFINASEKKRVWHNTNFASLAPPQHGSGQSVNSQKRARQLSVVFSDHINNIVSSGEAHPLLPEIGFSVSEVRMATDFSHMVIKWNGTGTTKDDQIEEVLPEAAAYIRKALTNMRLMGHVPMIRFVKDLTNARVQEVEALLSVADFGPDFEPGAPGHDLKDLSQKSATMATIQDDFDKLAKQFDNHEFARSSHFVKNQSNESDNLIQHDEQDKDYPNLAAIGINVKSDIYNVDHSAMLSKIKQATKHKPRVSKVTSMEENSTKLDSQKRNTSSNDTLSIADKRPSKGKLKAIARKTFASQQNELMRHPVPQKDTNSGMFEDTTSDYIIQEDKQENSR